jgi:hypothetical protein
MVQRFTVYDVLEAKGVFKKNPANVNSQDEQGATLYTGPVYYPRMIYHPTGEERIIQEGEVINTPFGPKVIMQQREMIWRIVNNAAEEAEATAAGWHLHPAEAMRAGGKEAPATGADQVITDLKRKIAALEAQQASLQKEETKPNPMQKEETKPNPISL